MASLNLKLTSNFCYGIISSRLIPLFTVLLTGFLSSDLIAQDPLKFKAEVNEISKISVVQDTVPTYIVFTGSASIRLWKDIETYFPGKKIINSGIGGSQLSDILFYNQRLIINFKPKQIFIYGGDNDLEARGCPGTILKNAKTLVESIRKALPQTEIVFISIKPCPARWEQRAEQRELNYLLKQYASQTTYVKYIDIWTKMVDINGHLRDDLYLENGLHMNKTGYDIWAAEIRKVIK